MIEDILWEASFQDFVLELVNGKTGPLNKPEDITFDKAAILVIEEKADEFSYVFVS